MVTALFKVVLMGDGSVGKTSLRRTYMGEGFRAQYMITIGADFAVKKMQLEGGHDVSIQIWDLAGQEHFKSVRSTFYKGAQGALAVYSTVERTSYDNIKNWLEECWTNAAKKIPVVLIGNKIDLRPTHSCLSIEQGLEFVEKLREGFGTFIPIYFVETSAKTGKNVDDAFQKLGKTILGV